MAPVGLTVWNTPSHCEVPDTITPFLAFSASEGMNISATGIVESTQEASLHDSLRAPTTETIIQELRPGVDLNDLREAYIFLSASISQAEGGYGSANAIGLGPDANSTVRILINGWETREVC